MNHRLAVRAKQLSTIRQSVATHHLAKRLSIRLRTIPTPPSKKGKFTPSTKRKGQEAASEARDTTLQSGPPRPTTTPQPVAPSTGPPQFEESQHIPPTSTLPVSPYLLQATAHGQLDDKCYTIYNPKLRDDTKLPKITNFSFEPEYKWTEAFPIEPPRPPNYTRPEVENVAPKFEYAMDHPTAYKFHLMHLKFRIFE
jgi:hypothetical protein